MNPDNDDKNDPNDVQLQDEDIIYDIASSVELQPDSHVHLFFECPFSSKVWSIVTTYAELPIISPLWMDIISWLMPLSLKDSVTSIVGRLIVASSANFIWQERNNRVHAKPSRNEHQVAKIVVETVRSKLASISFKNKLQVMQMKATWKIA
ncbi:hypothetical protein Tco_0064886 [Tanacetum coccineum]